MRVGEDREGSLDLFPWIIPIVGVTAPKLLEALHARCSPKIDTSKK